MKKIKLFVLCIMLLSLSSCKSPVPVQPLQEKASKVTDSPQHNVSISTEVPPDGKINIIGVSHQEIGQEWRAADGPISEGLICVVSMDHKVGYVDKDFNVVIEPIFDYYNDLQLMEYDIEDATISLYEYSSFMFQQDQRRFYKGRALTSYKKQVGFIDRKGKFTPIDNPKKLNVTHLWEQNIPPERTIVGDWVDITPPNGWETYILYKAPVESSESDTYDLYGIRNRITGENVFSVAVPHSVGYDYWDGNYCLIRGDTPSRFSHRYLFDKDGTYLAGGFAHRITFLTDDIIQYHYNGVGYRPEKPDLDTFKLNFLKLNFKKYKNYIRRLELPKFETFELYIKPNKKSFSMQTTGYPEPIYVLSRDKKWTRILFEKSKITGYIKNKELKKIENLN